LGHCHQRESACSGMFHKWECTNLMWSGLGVRPLLLISTDAKLNLYLFLRKLSIGAECSGISARKYKNDCAQVLKTQKTNSSEFGLRGLAPVVVGIRPCSPVLAFFVHDFS
jgi:hypothetical protein